MPLSVSATRALLASLGHEPRRFLGQNFLVDGNIVRKSLALGGVAAGDTVVEIGPGLGTLTESLLAAGAEVWAVEKDRTLADHLAQTLVPRFPATLHLTEGDAVELPLAGVPAERPLVKVIANLPYAIATPWLDAVLSGPLPARLVLMLQREAADRYAAQPGTKAMGAISIFLQSAYQVLPGHPVSADCFFPKPIVASYLLNLELRPAPLLFPAARKILVRQCFQQRRKQIGSLLRALLPATETGWRELLQEKGLSESMRPEQLPLSWWQAWASLPPSAA